MRFCLANAHARLLILATVLLIAATLPLEGQYASYLPVLQTTDADGLGIALVNPTIAEATVTLTVRSYSGALIQKDGVVNPVTLSLPASSQKALQAVEIFGNGISGQTGWIELSASTPAVKGCFMIYDSGLSYIDGSEISSRLSRRLIFPKVSSFSPARVTIVNTAQDLVQGFISAYEDGGGLVGTAVLTLPALGGFSGTVNELVPSIAGFEGYLVVESQTRPGSEGPQSLLGFETYRNRADIALIRAFPEAARQRTAQLAHLVSGGGYSTTLTLLNDRGYSQTIRITAQLEGNGQLYGPRLVGVERIIPPNGRLREPVEQLFGLQGNSLTTGYIRYETQGDTPGVFGYLDYGTTDGIALSAVEAQGQGYSDIFFSVLAENFAYYTGVALLNLNTQPATVTLEMFDRTGGRTGSAIFTLSAGERRTRLLGEFFQSAVDQVGGYIRITSTRPIFALELVGSRATSSFLADVSAQGVNLIPQASGSMVSASAGAEVIAEDGTASILIPPNALSADTPIRVVHSGIAGVQRPSVNQRPVSVVDTAPAGTRLQIPVRLTFSLDAQVPPGMRIPLLAFNRQTSQYETTKFFAAADGSGRIASAEVTYLTTFVVSLPDNRPVTVTSLEPSSGQSGAVVTIAGDGFSANAAENVVTFAGANNTTVPAQVLAASNLSISVAVPAGAVTGPVIVQVGSKSSIGLIFTVLTAPVIAPPPPTVNPAPISGPVFYVSTSGSDSNSGSSSAPWRTIQKAANAVGAGNTVNVSAGTYNERIKVTRSGASGSPITFQGQGSVLTYGFEITTNYIRVIGFDIRTVSGGFPNGMGVYIYGSHNELLNNYIHNTCNEGVWAYGGSSRDSATTSYNTIKGNTIVRAQMTGIMVEGQNNLVESNDISHTLQTPPGCGTSGDADGIRYFGVGHTIRKNHVHDILLSESPTAHIDATQTWGPAKNMIFEQNVFDIANDIIPGQTVGLGFTMESVDGQVDGLIIRNNVFINHYTGYGIDTQTSTSTPLSNLTIVNNTFVRVDGYGTGGGGMGIWITGKVQNAIIKNNAFYDYGYDGDNYIRVTGGSGLDIGNNSITKSNGAAPSGSPSSGDLWMVDAKFVSVAARDFHLQSTSPLIDKALTLSTVTDDLDGTPRPQGRPYDIGAFQYK